MSICHARRCDLAVASNAGEPVQGDGMNDQRPDPDALLARVHAEEGQQARGKLKIFFGAERGWAKPTPTPEAAQARRADGVRCGGGLGRYALRGGDRGPAAGAGGAAPPPVRGYRGATLYEFDLDVRHSRAQPAWVSSDSTGAQQRARFAARQALAGCGGGAGGGQ